MTIPDLAIFCNQYITALSYLVFCASNLHQDFQIQKGYNSVANSTMIAHKGLQKNPPNMLGGKSYT